MSKSVLKCVAYFEDDQSGGFNITLYPTWKAFLNDVREDFEGLTDQEIKQIYLDEEDGYENGYAKEVEIPVKNKSNILELAEETAIHFGQ